MENLSLPQKLYYAYLGRALAATYYSQRRKILWIAISSWIKWIAFLAFAATLIFRMGQTAVLVTFFIFLWIQFSYWRAGKMGYNKFVADKQTQLPQDIEFIPAEEKTLFRASGTFAVSSRESTLFMHPAEYWRAPLGDHIVMAYETKTQYLYQFFTSDTLRNVEKGWIIFGKEPLQTLALTIVDLWGPAHENNAINYYVGGGQNTNNKQNSKTIYFTFEGEEELVRVWATIVGTTKNEQLKV